VIFGGRHLDDEHLLGCYLGPEGGKDAAANADHLAACPRCSTRYDDLVRFMQDLRAEADAETDDLFPPEHLQAQQQAIARRLDQFGTARIISFPGRVAAKHDLTSSGRLGSRWIAAAAAAGLLVGAAVGTFYEGSWRLVPQTAGSRIARAPISGTPSDPSLMLLDPSRAPSFVDDEMLLSDLERALGGPRTQELLPFEALTPRATDISVQLR
jgi:hypothetical protein